MKAASQSAGRAMMQALKEWGGNGDKFDGMIDRLNARQLEAERHELHRPYIRNGTREQIEENAPRTADGRPIDPNTLRPVEGKPDIGHKPGNEFWREKQKAEQEGIGQKEFNDRMNDPNKYQLEDPSSNRSHRHEMPKDQEK